MVVMSNDGCAVCIFEDFVWEVAGNSIVATNRDISKVFGVYETRDQAISMLSNLYQTKRMKFESCTL